MMSHRLPANLLPVGLVDNHAPSYGKDASGTQSQAAVVNVWGNLLLNIQEPEGDK